MNTYPRMLNLSALLFIAVSMASCYGAKKTELREAINRIVENQKKEVEELKLSEQKKTQALNDERIDTTISNRIESKLSAYYKSIDSLNNEISHLQQQLNDPRAFRRAYQDSIKPKLALLEQYSLQTQQRLTRVNMIKEAMDISKQNLFNLAAFFGSGKYIIPKDNYSQASTLFLPAIDSLILFSNKYADVPRTSTIVVNGFADGQNIDQQSELYQILLQVLKKNTADKQQLNSGLSELRASEISDLLEKLLEQKDKEFLNPEKLSFAFYGYGQGETYPSKKITDYAEDDERRRIVLVYWSVIPD